MFHKRRDRFKFTEKRHSKKGIITMSIAIFLLVLYLILLFVSYQTAGNLSMYYGSIGVTALVVAIVNTFFSIQSMFEENSFQLFPRLATFLSLLSLIGWGAMYIAGFLF